MGQTYLLTVKMDFTAGTDALTLYVNPTPGLAGPDSAFSASKSNLDLGTFTRIELAGGRSFASNNASLDELRIGGSYLDVAPAGRTISGTLYNDVNADASVSAGEGVFSGATVRLWRDNGNGSPGSGDTLAGTTTSNASGQYSFGGLPDGTYWVSVDSKTLGASGYNSGYTASSVWAEQTYGVAGAMQGAGFLAADGALYGGRNASTSDNASAPASSEHVTRVNVAGAAVAGIDAGFSFSAVTNARGDALDDDGGSTGRLQQGSLRQFLINSNAIAGMQSANFSVGSGSATITPTSALPIITDAVVLDATTQEGFASTPLVELNGSSAGASASGFTLNAAGGGSTIRGFVINRFGADLIHLSGSDNNVIAGNYLGTDATGTLDRGATDSGVLLDGGASGNRIGGTTAADRNLISGNNYSGINITDSGTNNNLVQGNLIGTAVNGTSALGNSSFGVVIWNGASGNQIGGVAAGAGNVVAYNARGVIVDANTVNAVNNAILGNRIFGNTNLGIDLYAAGVRNNDAGDADTGPNNYQNFPVLSVARTDGAQVNLTGTLNSTAGTRFRIEFFASAAADASGYGEGQRYLGFVNVTTDAAGNASFNTLLTAAVAVGDSISATATRSDASFSTFYDTSEFAQNITAVSPNSPPVNTLPGPQTVNEDTVKVFSAANGNQISITDVDAGGANNEVTLSVTNGSLTLAGTAGLSFTAGDGTADATMTFRGTAAAINTALNGVSYLPAANYNGGAMLTLATKDSALLSLDADTGLRGRYAFENAGALGADTSPAAGYPGTVSGATAANDGTRGNVLDLAGAGYVQTTGHFGNPANVTLAAWVNLTIADSGGAEVISLGDSVVLRLDDTNGTLLKGTFYNGSTWVDISHAVTLAGTGWHHVAYTVNDTGNAATLYLDGAVVGATSTTTSISYTRGANSFIGKHGNGGSSFDFNGRIDDARIYARALTASEIATLAADLPLTDTDTVAITVVAVNDAPTATNLNAAESYTEDTAKDLINIVVSDVDSASVTATLTLVERRCRQLQHRHLGCGYLDLRCRHRACGPPVAPSPTSIPCSPG